MQTTENGFLVVHLVRSRFLTDPVFTQFDEHNVVHRVMQFMLDNPDEFARAPVTLRLTPEDAVGVLQHFCGTDGAPSLRKFVSATRTTVRVAPGGPIDTQRIESNGNEQKKEDMWKMADCLYRHKEFRSHLCSHPTLAQFAPAV